MRRMPCARQRKYSNNIAEDAESCVITVEKVIFLQDVDVSFERYRLKIPLASTIADEVSAEAGRGHPLRGRRLPTSMYLVLDGSIRLHRGGAEVMVAKPERRIWNVGAL
ncbi:MAG: hypothetical protein IPP40_07250 [bacterium]|nr:hypothetical protein [bacterium]